MRSGCTRCNSSSWRPGRPTWLRLQQSQVELQAAKTSYGVLVDAFGRGGIQALLIEAALPELEAQANDLLARLTDHRMTLSLETQRQNRRGDVLGDAGDSHRRRAGHPQLRAVQRRRGLSHRLRPAGCACQAAGFACGRAPAHAFH